MANELKVGDTVYGYTWPNWGWVTKVVGDPRIITRETDTQWITDEGSIREAIWVKECHFLHLYDDEAKAYRQAYEDAEHLMRMLIELNKMDLRRIWSCTGEVSALLTKAVELLNAEE